MEKMRITSEMRENCLSFIEKMAYAKSSDEYDGLYAQFLTLAPESVKVYFNKNWMPIREEWVACFKQTSGNFMNSTNNRLESINGKLKQVIDKYSSLEFFIDNFFVILPVLRNQRNYTGAYQGQKQPVRPFAPNSPESLYTSLLTPYASSFVLKQLEIYANTTYDFTPSTIPGVYTVVTSEGKIEVSSSNCACCFCQSMKLPCRHIFHVRNNLAVSLFDRNLCAERWTTTFSNAQRKSLMTERESDVIELEVGISEFSRNKKWTSQQKYSRALDVCKKIANTIAMSSQEDFEHRVVQNTAKFAQCFVE